MTPAPPSPSRRPLLAAALLLACVAGAAVFVDEVPRGPDFESYFGFARSLFYDGDLLLLNEFEILQKTIFVVPETGYASVLANVGAALFWLPAFVTAHATVGVTNALQGTRFAADGFNPYYMLWVNLWNWLYGFVALLLIYRLSRRYFSRAASLAALGLVCFATPFFYYMSYFTPSTSIPAALAAVLCLTAWEEARRGGRAHWLLLGSLLGLALSIATYNAGFLAFPLVTLADDLRRRERWNAVAARAAWLAIGIAVGYLPQLLAWQVLFGTPRNPYAATLDPFNARVLEVLFSTYHGLYFYAPFLLVATAGLVALWRRDRALAAGWAGAFAVHAYAVGTLIGWWAGDSFGIRYFVGLTPLFALSAAALFESVAGRRGVPWALGALCAACLLWNYLLFLGIYANGVSLGEYYTLDEQWANQLSALARLPALAAEHWRPLKSPLVLPVLAPFALTAGTVLAAGWFALKRGFLRGSGALSLLALSPLLLAVAVVRAGQVGAEHLDFYRALPEFALFPQGIGDPLDLSAQFGERGKYHFRLGDLAAADADFRRAQEIVPNNSYARLRGSDIVRVPNPLGWDFGNHVLLAGYGIDPPAPRRGETLRVTLYWQVLAQPVRSYFVRLALVGADGQVVASTDEFPTQGQLAFTRWRAGELIRDAFSIAAPQSIAAGTALAVRVRLIEKDTRQRLATRDRNGENDGVLITVTAR